jgi:uncharacterized protein (TIGR00730 family)
MWKKMIREPIRFYFLLALIIALFQGSLECAASPLHHRPFLACREALTAADEPHEVNASVLIDDLRLAISTLEALPPAIAFLGGSRVTEHDGCYPLALEIGELLAKQGIPVCTGGGPGIMEFVPRGYRRGRSALKISSPSHLIPPVTKGFPAGASRSDHRVQGFTVLLPYEQKRNTSIEVGAEFKDMAIRKVALTENKRGFCFFPGGFGTEDEFYEIWNRDITVSSKDPLIVAGSDYWEPQLEALEKVAVKERSLISPTDMARIRGQIVDDAPRFLSILSSARNPCGFEDQPEDLFTSLEKDIKRAAETYGGYSDAVTFIGSPRLSPDDKTCALAKTIASRLASNNVPLRVGSGGRVAQCILQGAAENGTAQRVEGFFTQGDVTPSCAAALRLSPLIHNPVIHKRFLSGKLLALVVLPGDTRTLSEFFGLLCLMQTGSLAKRPLILLGKDYWGPMFNAYEKTMLTRERRLIAPDDLRLVTITDDAEMAVDIIERSLQPAHSTSHVRL